MSNCTNIICLLHWCTLSGWSMFSGFWSICWRFASSDGFAWACLRMAGKNDLTVSQFHCWMSDRIKLSRPLIELIAVWNLLPSPIFENPGGGGGIDQTVRIDLDMALVAVLNWNLRHMFVFYQVLVCGILLVVMAVGNFVNTMETLVLKLRFKAKMKRAKNRQDRPHQSW